MKKAKSISAEKVIRDNFSRKKPGEVNPFKSGYTALLGTIQVLRSESSVRGFALAGLVIVAGSVVVRMGSLYTALLMLVWTLVTGFEILNTALEEALDFASGKAYHPLVRKAKDFAAGAVFVMAASAWTITAWFFLEVIGR